MSLAAVIVFALHAVIVGLVVVDIVLAAVVVGGLIVTDVVVVVAVDVVGLMLLPSYPRPTPKPTTSR